MADRIVTVDVQSNLKEQTRQAREFNKELDRAQSATRTGSRAADAALGVSEGGRGLTRGATGAGGRGSERDFARQAQGLGGLVHVYATFAANIYAVTAAFGALQRAADITNMLKSADALSSRYGVSLRSVASELKNITDQAISTEEALQFSAMGASAGLSSQQLKDLATAATGASKALGRDLTDSMQRIYRGAIKLEPELLDELGIMVKVEEASQEYARSLNKSVLSLTTFEKQQAFVNAVIEQGNSKFKEAAELSANPYTRLVASIKELQQEGLSLINTVLGPIVNILAQSPTALIAAVGLLIAKLAKLAMPDLLPKAEQRFEAAAAAAETAATKMKEANKGIAKAFEQTTAFAFISAPDQTKLVKQAADLGRKLKDSLEADIAASTGREPVKFSIDTEDLRRQYETALIKAQRNAQAIIDRPTTTANVRTDKTALLASLSAELKMVQALEGGLGKLANEEKLAAQARISENIATIGLMREQNNLAVTQLQMKHKYFAAVIEAYRAEQRITAELKAQNQQMGGSAAKGTGIAISGTLRALGTGAKAAALSLLGLTGPAAAVSAAVAMVAGALYSAGRAFGIFTNASEKVAKASAIAKDNINTLAASTAKLAATTSFNEVFELKMGNLKLIGETTNALRDLTIEFDNFAKSATLGDKVLEWFKDLLPLIDSVSEATGKTFAGTLSRFGELGQIDPTQVRSTLEKTIARERGGRDIGDLQDEFMRLGQMSLAELLAEAFKSPAAMVEVRKIQNRMEELGKEAASTAASMSQVKDSVKTLGDTTKDYVNKLLPQTELTKAQTAAIQGFTGAIANTEAAVKFTEAFTRELAAFTNVDISASVKQAQQEFKALEDAISFWKREGIPDKEINRLADISRAQIAAQNNLFSNITAFTINLTNSTTAMGLAAINTEKAIANLNRQLKLISIGEEVIGGPTRSTEARRIATEKAIAERETQALRTQQSQINQLLAGRAKIVSGGLTAANISGISEEQLRGTEGLQTLAAKITEAQAGGATKERLAELLNAYDALSNLQLAQLAVQGKLDVAQAKSISKLEETVRLSKADSAEKARSSELLVKDRENEIQLLQETQQLYASISPILSDLNATEIRRLEAEKQAINLGNEYFKLQESRAQLEASRVTIGEKEYSRRLVQLNLEEGMLNRTRTRLGITTQLKNQIFEIEQAERRNLATQDLYNKNLALQESLIAANSNNIGAQYLTLKASLATRDTLLKTELASLDAEIQKQHAMLTNADVRASSAKAFELEAKIASLQLERQKKLVDTAKQELEIRKELVTLGLKRVEAGDDPQGFRDYMRLAGEDFINKIKQARSEAEPIASILNSGLTQAIDDSIDRLATGLMEGSLDWEEFGRLARNALAEAYRDAAAQVLKNAWKDMMIGITGPTPEDQQISALTENTLKLSTLSTSIANLTTTLQTQKLSQPTQFGMQSQLGFGTATKPQELRESVTSEPSWWTASSTEFEKAAGVQADTAIQVQAAANTQTEASKTAMTAADTAMLSSTMLLAFTGQWKQAAFMFLAQLASTMLMNAATGTANTGIAAAVSSFFGFANGGIMSSAGPLPVNTYARGGIASSPQVAVFGEGRQNEAYVPLPDNRSIPVTLTGGGGNVSVGDTNISINIQSNGSSEVTPEQSSEFGKQLSISIKKIVNDEIIKQSRPGGLFYGVK